MILLLFLTTFYVRNSKHRNSRMYLTSHSWALDGNDNTIWKLSEALQCESCTNGTWKNTFTRVVSLIRLQECEQMFFWLCSLGLRATLSPTSQNNRYLNRPSLDPLDDGEVKKIKTHGQVSRAWDVLEKKPLEWRNDIAWFTFLVNIGYLKLWNYNWLWSKSRKSILIVKEYVVINCRS